MHWVMENPYKKVERVALTEFHMDKGLETARGVRSASKAPLPCCTASLTFRNISDNLSDLLPCHRFKTKNQIPGSPHLFQVSLHTLSQEDRDRN